MPKDFDRYFFLSINSTSKEQDITQRKKIRICSPTPSSLSSWESPNQWAGYYIRILKPSNTLIHRAEGRAKHLFVKTSDSKPLLPEQQLEFLLGAVARSDQPGYQKHRRPLLLFDRMVLTTKESTHWLCNVLMMLPESKTFREQPLIANSPELHSLLTSLLTPHSATAHS